MQEVNVALVKGDEKNRGKWKIVVVILYLAEMELSGRLGFVRARVISKDPIQFLHPMELQCAEEKHAELNQKKESSDENEEQWLREQGAFKEHLSMKRTGKYRIFSYFRGYV